MAGVVRQRADWSDVRLFWAVAELGSFGAAARTLNVGLSTVTRAVDRLETRLNAKLIVRGPLGVTLTEAGSVAFDRALSMERMAQQLEYDIADAERRAEGRVKLAAPDGIGGAFLPRFMPEFLRANPKIDLIIDCGFWSGYGLPGDIDLTLTFDQPKSPEVPSTKLATFHYCLFASREYLDLYGTPQTLAECVSRPFVHHTAQTHHLDEWRPGATAAREVVQKRIETNSSAVSLAAIKQGVGIGPLPTAILAIEPDLVMLDLPVQASVSLWLIHHHDIARSARIRCVVDWLKDCFDPRTMPWYRSEFVHPRDFEHLLRPADPVAAEAAPRRPRVRAAS